MLAAEIHGHAVAELKGNEDYLTSAVLGHLRYVPPSVFWLNLFGRAITLPTRDTLRSLRGYVGSSWHQYDSLAVKFWPSHPTLGTPDAVLVFTGPGVKVVVLILEFKLWAEKSGTGENDQLFRYLCILEDLEPLGLSLKNEEIESAIKAVVYVKPSDPLPDLLDTAALCFGDFPPSDRLYGLEWQDLVEAAEESLTLASGVARLVLADVALFLKRRGLEYFKGFRAIALPQLTPGDGSFYSTTSEFAGFSTTKLDHLDKIDGEFYHSRQT